MLLVVVEVSVQLRHWLRLLLLLLSYGGSGGCCHRRRIEDRLGGEIVGIIVVGLMMVLFKFHLNSVFGDWALVDAVAAVVVALRRARQVFAGAVVAVAAAAVRQIGAMRLLQAVEVVAVGIQAAFQLLDLVRLRLVSCLQIEQGVAQSLHLCDENGDLKRQKVRT